MSQMKNIHMRELFNKVNGSFKDFHTHMCEMNNINPNMVNASSLYWKGKTYIEKMKRLQKHKDKTEYDKFCNDFFHFPKTSTKRKASPVNENCEIKKKKYEDLEKMNHKLRNETCVLRFKLRNLNIYRLNRQLKRQQNTIDRLKLQIKNMQKHNNDNKVRDLCEKGVQCNTLRLVIQNLQTELDELKSEIDENNNVSECSILKLRQDDKRGRPYDNNLREIYYFLRSIHVPLHNIDPIIRKVLTLVNYSVEELPSVTMASKLTSELGLVTRKHVYDEVSQCENLTMLRDGTTKKGRHFYGIQFSTGEKTLTAGLRETSDEKGETLVAACKGVLNDINPDSTCLPNVKNFMTDRCATEQKVNNLLVDEIGKITESSDVECHSFKCAVHPLLQFSDVCQKECSKIERESSVEIGFKSNESVFSCLLRSVSKLFYKDGTGDPLLVRTYLQNMGILNPPIMNYRGNRFNVLFFNSAGTYYLRTHILHYLQSSKTSLNFMQNFIVTALQNTTITSIIRALGIISKVITEPYWQIVGGDSSAIHMGTIYRRLIDVLDCCCKDTNLLLRNEIRLFYGPDRSPPDQVSISLFQTSSNDLQTANILEALCKNLKCKSQSLFKDFIDGGKYFNPSIETVEACKTCPSHNISSERVMAKLDSSLKVAPSSSINTLESTIMYRNNNTSDWLHSKDKEEKDCIIDKARSENNKFLEKMKRRKNELFQQQVNIIQQREECVKQKAEKKEEIMRKSLEEVAKLGLLKNREEIESQLQRLTSKKDKVTCLKKQINLYKTLFSFDTCEKHLFCFSKKGKQFDIDILTENLVKIISKSQSKSTQNIMNSDSFKFRDNILKNPVSLCGKMILHTWTDENEDIKWKGKILSFKKGNFQITYWVGEENKDEEDIYDLTKEELCKDYVEGNLTFIGKFMSYK